MAKKIVSFKTKGMNRDLSVSAFNPEFSFENRNLRLSTNEGNTMLSWVNEKGTTKMPCNIIANPWASESAYIYTSTIAGYPIGTAVINSQLVLFTTDNISNGYDYIYVLNESGNTNYLDGKLLYKGHLGFNIKYPLETLVSYESSNIQKVYWTDNYNQPRVINIAAPVNKISKWNHGGSYADYKDTFFDFIPELKLQEDVKIKKILGANGSFAPGVIQYAFTYYNKYCQESSIFYVSPILYISYKDRGASPEDTRVENAFRISVGNLDTNYDYLRIYSIQRTSVNATPIAKRVQDISIDNITGNTVSFTDTGTSGETVDPTELLYKGGEDIVCKTIEQKDNTLFFGNLKLTRPYIEDSLKGSIKAGIKISNSTRTIYPTTVTGYNYVYSNQLTSYDSASKINSTQCSGFKAGDTYRLGVQFQYKNGKWSNPIWIGDYSNNTRPTAASNTVTLPAFKGVIDRSVVNSLLALGYKRVRGIVVFPSIQDRKTLCQGIACPTMYTDKHNTGDRDINAQSSWFFRTQKVSTQTSSGLSSPVGRGTLPYTSRNTVTGTLYNPNSTANNIKTVEIQGDYDSENKFKVGTYLSTLHSPEFEFDEYLASSDFTDVNYRFVGQAKILRTFSDIDIQTESPTISNSGSGFEHKSSIAGGMLGIVSGLFYDDYLVDDNDKNANSLNKYPQEKSSVKWMVYLWNKNGSLNNDINRNSNAGTPSAVLKKKIISNLRFADTPTWNTGTVNEYVASPSPQLFMSDEPTILKVGEYIYMGNIDMLLSPDNTDGMYFALNSTENNAVRIENIHTYFANDVKWKTFSTSDDISSQQGVWKYDGTSWKNTNTDIGDFTVDLVLKKDSVRMKYKSTPHLVAQLQAFNCDNDCLPVVEITRNLDLSTIYGGTSEDALRENNWVPCGEPVTLEHSTSNGEYSFYYSYGDTYFQRWDCLKTYPYTTEDINQVVEIGSFMLETRVNIDGRYDRNRGQINNLNMSPRNFNLFNPVYTQTNNFFTYRILDSDSYKNTSYLNQITWSLTKSSGADVDAWTNITLASTMELDGDKGGVNKLIRFNNQLLAFQDTGIAQILYNENIQVASTQGVPIEIANSGKVQGKRYISDTIGCSNKYSLVSAPTGIYFMDNIDKSIYLFNGQLQNLSTAKSFNSWAKNNISTPDNVWYPDTDNGFLNFVAYYDKLNQDILFINKDIALAYSEKIQAFTSFYDYGNTPYFVNMHNSCLWVKHEGNGCSIYSHNTGNYCNFFGTVKPYWMTLIANPEPQTSKVFTNLELRAIVNGDGSNSTPFSPLLPFDTLDVWDEYQHGIQSLANRTGKAYMQHYTKDEVSTLKRKFRIWRADIPRDNAPLTSDAGLNISRFKPKPLDRIRNPWIYLKLEKDNPVNRAEIHDVVLTYFN